MFDKPSLLTVKNPRLQLVKIDHVILGYLSLTGKTVRQKIITYVRLFKKFKPLPISTNMVFIELLLQRKLFFLLEYILYTQVI